MARDGVTMRSVVLPIGALACVIAVLGAGFYGAVALDRRAAIVPIDRIGGVSVDDARPSNIRSDETVVFFPTLAYRNGEHWIVPIHAWVYEAEAGDLLRGWTMSAVRDALDLDELEDDDDDENALSADEFAARRQVFDRRTALFLVDNERNKRLTIRWGDRAFELPGVTGSEGHLQATIALPAEAVTPGEPIRFTALLPDGDERTFEGVSRPLAAEGLTVVSDIDDTVKVSHVTDKRALLRKTFYEEFAAVPGMAARYGAWSDEHDAAFVFVSSSPWQLYPELSAMLDAAEFPQAAFALKTFRVKDERFLDLFADPFEAKVQRIGSIIERYPGRRYILVGDSGEKDPEVYAETMRRHPQQVQRAWIRVVDPLRDDAGALTEAWRARVALMRETGAENWRLILPSDVPGEAGAEIGVEELE